MSKIDWSYHRRGCNSCQKTQAYLAANGIETATEVDAKKVPIQRDAALDLLKGIGELHVVKGKKVVQVNLKQDRPDDDELAKLLLGPTGKLRAPTVRKGKLLMVGFNEEMYEAGLS